ncbi:hypothetical protein SAMN05414137_12333 [Streptacidiphilus jiangxiensis]|uniref:Uncharacterized protein n=1 Tax=Streptacidiphilus jiangxiensis TaxID=235985 RepID=A0A1H7X843_STRJI|nr:hypothetical protein SAMN05414137_12333 [Streptacidiphilus jiangxiensis]
MALIDHDDTMLAVIDVQTGFYPGGSMWTG